MTDAAPYQESYYTRLEKLRVQMETERSSFITHYKDLGDFLAVRRVRLSTTDVNRGDKRYSNILDNTGLLAVRTLRAGMMAGVTSPSRPWFRLTTQDQDVSELEAVKVWLHTVTKRMEWVFLKSNLYNSLPIVYGDLGVFATAAMLIEQDLTGEVIRTTPLAIGSYCLGQDKKRNVCTLVRDFQMTVRQIVEEFGMEEGSKVIDWTNISGFVQQQWEQGYRETWIQVTHIIHPNDDWDPDKFAPKYKRYRSVYYERCVVGQDKDNFVERNQKFLSDSGYDRFTLLAPRWEKTGEDVYGTSCPGMEALGDVKQLQVSEKRILQAIEKSINPPLTGPSALKSTKTSILPGDITYNDELEGRKGFRPVYQIDPRINEMEAKQAQVRERINRAFYADLFLMLAQSDRREITAREVEERHEEKLLALGPVLEQLNADLLNPLIKITFGFMKAQGLIPDMPEEMRGQPLKIEYVSVMAQAQKLVGIYAIERFTGFIMSMAEAVPEILHKFDADQTVDIYGDRIGLDPGVIRTDEAVAQIREGLAKAQQADATAEALPKVAGAARDLAAADLEKDSALKRLTEQSNAGKLVNA